MPGSEYLPLQKLYYQEQSSERDTKMREEAARRLLDASTFRTGIEIASGELFLAMPRQLALISEKLLRVERKVSHLWRDLPGIARWAFLRGLIMDEIVGTNQIEGVYSTRRQISEALDSIKTNEHKRFREFANLYLELTKKNHINPSTPVDIRGIYDAVVAGELDPGQMPDGELFRAEEVTIVDSRGERVIHHGVYPEEKISQMLKQMIALADSPDIPTLFTAIMAHFLFEYIHPFYDGNGRTGRYLQALYLSEPLSHPTVLSLSAVIAEHKGAYYKAFLNAEAPLNQGEVTFFVIQMMEFIRIAQDSVIENLEDKKETLLTIENRMELFTHDPYTLSQKEVTALFQVAQYHLFGAFPEITLAEIAEYGQVSTQTARRYSRLLEEKGLIKTVHRRPLKFRLTRKALEALGIDETPSSEA